MTVVRLAQAGGESNSIREASSFGSTPHSISSVLAYTGTRSIRASTSTDEGTGWAFAVDYTEMRMAYMFNHGELINVGLSNYIHLARFRDANVVIVDVTMNEDDEMVRLWTNGVERDSISMAACGLLDTATWRAIGVTMKIGAPGFASFYVNGVKHLTYVGTITGAIDNVQFTATDNAAIIDPYFDDIYLDSTVGELDAAPSTRRFLWTLPDAAGANAEWTPNTGLNYAAVDEATPDGETTYIKTLVTGVRDSYNYAAVTIPADHVIRAVIPYPYLRKTDAATPAEITLHAFDGAIYETGAAEADLPVDYGFRFTRFPLQPDASAWNETDLNAMQFGISAAGAW